MSSSAFFEHVIYLICYIQLKKTGSKLARKIWRFVLAKALPFTFHSNAIDLFMQKVKIIVGHVSHFQEKLTCFNVHCFLFISIFSLVSCFAPKPKQVCSNYEWYLWGCYALKAKDMLQMFASLPSLPEKGKLLALVKFMESFYKIKLC